MNIPVPVISSFIAKKEPELFSKALQIRRDVFVDEQGTPPDMEPDTVDFRSDCVQFLLYDNTVPVATGRLFPEADNADTGTFDKPDKRMARIGRMAIQKTYRGSGLGKFLLKHILDVGQAQYGYSKFVLDAQEYAQGFYRSCGFQSVGERFIPEGDNLWHVKMVLVTK